MRSLYEELQPNALTSVVDVGANPIDGDTPYKKMLADGLCAVTGFEPQEHPLEALRAVAGPLEFYFPEIIGDGSIQTLYHTQSPGMTSLLEPDEKRLALFNGFSDWGKVMRTEEVSTTCLDDIEHLQHMDMLKVDTQGSEPAIFDGAHEKLKNCVVVHTEISFVPLYRSQPTFGEVDEIMRHEGFVPHMFYNIKRWAIAPTTFDSNIRIAGNQLLEADIVYVKDFGQLDKLTTEQIKHLALIAHHVYRSIDLVHICLLELENREVISKGLANEYLGFAFTPEGGA